MPDIPKIFADFNNADRHGRVRLNCVQVILDDDDSLTALGIIKFSQEENIWVAEINWESL